MKIFISNIEDKIIVEKQFLGHPLLLGPIARTKNLQDHFYPSDSPQLKIDQRGQRDYQT